MRRHLLVFLALLLGPATALTVTACGGSEETDAVTAGGETVATQGDEPRDPFAQLRFVLEKFPYKPWYRECLVKQVEGQLSASQLEELAELPDEQARRAALKYALGASPKCEGDGREPIETDADEVEVQLLRLGYSTTLEALGEREGLSSSQSDCLGRAISKFGDEQVIELGNASGKRREAVLVGVIEGCASR